MNKARWASYMVFAGMLILFSSIVLSSSFVSQWKQLNGSHALGKLSATIEIATDPTGTAGLTLNDAMRLSNVWGEKIAYDATLSGRVEAGGRSASGDIIGISGNYVQFTNVRMRTGAFVTVGAVLEAA